MGSKSTLYDGPVAFQFKGDRTYVHGTDMFAEVLMVARRCLGADPEEIAGSFHALLDKEARLRIFLEEADSVADDAVAVLRLTVEGRKYRAELTPGDPPVASSYPYDDEDVVVGAVVEGKTITMASKENYTYIEQIVALTKKLHHAVYPDVRDKWLFSKIDLRGRVDPAAYAGRTIAVVAQKNFQNRLSQCAIRVDDEPVGRIYFTALREGAAP
jgi:hypothetical protein